MSAPQFKVWDFIIPINGVAHRIVAIDAAANTYMVSEVGTPTYTTWSFHYVHSFCQLDTVRMNAFVPAAGCRPDLSGVLPAQGENEFQFTFALPTLDKECNHKYVSYNGLIESYEYCLYCDKKKV